MTTTNGSTDPVILATAGYDHTIRFWQAHSGICYRTVQHPDSQVNALEITPDKQLVAAAGYQHIRMYDLNSNNPNPIVNYDGISKNISTVGFHEDGKWMYTGGEDNTARIWDLRSRNLQCQRMFRANAPVTCVCLHPNQGELFVGDQDGSIHIWDLKTDNNEQLIPDADAAIQSISIDPMGTMMAAVNNKGRCYIWSLTGGRDSDPSRLHPKSKFEAHGKYALKCLFSPDSTVKIFNVTRGVPPYPAAIVLACRLESCGLTSITLTSTSDAQNLCRVAALIHRLLATTAADQSCKVWKTADLSLLTELKESTQRWVWDCAFSGDSQYIITASSDNMARLWNVESGEVKREYSGHQKAVVCLAFRDEVVQ